MKKIIGFKFAAAGTFVATMAIGALAVTLTAPATPVLEAPTEERSAHASWASSAETVLEQVMEADVVVRVQTIGQDRARGFAQPVPPGATPTRILFTDSQVEVLEVYQGKADVGQVLSVMQTGGQEMLRSGALSRSEVRDDPIYGAGDEMILFLVDISGDAVHAANRALYRTVNPNGRFQVEGSLVAQPFAEVHGKSLHSSEGDLADLETEIRDAVRERQVFDAGR